MSLQTRVTAAALQLGNLLRSECGVGPKTLIVIVVIATLFGTGCQQALKQSEGREPWMDRIDRKANEYFEIAGRARELVELVEAGGLEGSKECWREHRRFTRAARLGRQLIAFPQLHPEDRAWFEQEQVVLREVLLPECGFRSKPITDSGPSRSLIPAQADH